MKILCVGDIMGKPGRKAAKALIPGLREQHKLDAVIMNVENAAGGFGITPEIAEELLAAGADVMTSGNHIWDKREIFEYLNSYRPLLRPLNYPADNPGRGIYLLPLPEAKKLAVITIEGRTFMRDLDCPFRGVDKALESLSKQTACIVVDCHAETTSEKGAMGLYLDGRVSAVVGTHTHVQTADARILPKGTAFMTDLGMTGPHSGVIGMRFEKTLQRFLTQMPIRLEITKGDEMLHGAVIEIDEATGKAQSITAISLALE